MTEASTGSTPGRDNWLLRGVARLALAAAVALALAGLVWLTVSLDLTPPQRPMSNVLQSKAVALAPRVFLLGKLTPSVAYAVETSEGPVLIDSGLEPNAAGVLSQLKDLRVDVSRLRAILLTHTHGDHVLGAEHLRNLTGAKVYAGKGDCQPLREGGPREAFFSTFNASNEAIHKTTVDVELAGDEVLEFGDSRFTVLATPGHTPGSVCYLLEQQGQRFLFTGDVIQALKQVSGGNLGTYAAYLPPLYRGSARDYLASLKKLRNLPVPDLVLPGHPALDTPPQNPHLTKEQWHHLLDGGVAELERLLLRYETDGADFLDGSPKQLLEGLFYLGDLDKRAVYCVNTPKGLIVFDAPGGDALGEFLAERLDKVGLGGVKVVAVLLTSADKEATSGLARLVEQTGAKVVVSKKGLAAIRSLCPKAEVQSEDDFAEKGGGGSFGLSEFRTLPLAGRGTAPLAYAFRRANKTVLASGVIPTKPDPLVMEHVLREIKYEGNVREYLQSLALLVPVQPDLWLPAVPVFGQNANLYDREWEQFLERNAKMLESF